MWPSFCFTFKADNILFLFKFYAKLIPLKETVFTHLCCDKLLRKHHQGMLI